jgi:uncharacterized membrane protein YhaH (DUF805 family)
MPRKDKVKEERKSLYFDLICGIINSTLAIICIFFTTIVYGIKDVLGFSIGVTFCIFYLGVSIFLIFIGIYTKQKEKKYGIISKKKRKREIKAPIVS